MKAEEQNTFCELVKKAVKAKGYRMDYFYKRMAISPTHWSFIKRGERVLIQANRDKINKWLKTNY